MQFLFARLRLFPRNHCSYLLYKQGQKESCSLYISIPSNSKYTAFSSMYRVSNRRADSCLPPPKKKPLENKIHLSIMVFVGVTNNKYWTLIMHAHKLCVTRSKWRDDGNRMFL